MNPGTLVDGKYKIERMLGEGGMATVFAATHIHLNEMVAIKVLLSALAGNANIVERFMREARAAVRLKSEHVVRVKDVGSLPTQQPYIVMEFLDGTDLEAQLAKRGKLPPGEVVDYILQICEALAEAHSIGIVHRDMKPANCVLAQRADGMPCVKVLDFGIAKMMMGDDSGPKLTATSATMGTPAFMSPEQIRGAKDVDHRGDIWSVGVMLFELIAGHVPFQAKTYGLLVMAVMREPTPQLPDAPPGLQQVLDRALAKERDHRFQTVAELAQALEPYASNRAEAAVLVQRCVSLARPPGQRTPVSGVPVMGGSGGPATPAHGNQPMMSTPAHGMSPTHGSPMMSTPAQGMRPTHGGSPMMSTPAQGNPPQGTHGPRPMSTPGHGNLPMSTPGHGNPPMSTPGHGNPPMNTPGHGNPPMMSTPAQGMPPHGQHPMNTPSHGNPHGQHLMHTPGHGNQPMMSTPAPGMPPHGQQMPHGNQPMMQTGPHVPQMQTGPHVPVGTSSGLAPTTPAVAVAPKSRRVLWIALIGIVAGTIAGLVIMLAG